MKLTTILEEISVGYMQNDEKSERLKKYADEVRMVLEKQGSALEQKSLTFNYVELHKEVQFDRSLIFYQGSYAIHTGIKHNKYDVDADIAFYINENADFSIRERIYRSLRH